MRPDDQGDMKGHTMGIDGIGGGRPPIGPAGGASSATRVSGDGFTLDRSSSVAKGEGADKVASTEELQRVQSGDMSLDDYLQSRADKAVAHLRAIVSAEQLALIKEQLILQMRQEPTVVALVERATGVLSSHSSSGGR